MKIAVIDCKKIGGITRTHHKELIARKYEIKHDYFKVPSLITDFRFRIPTIKLISAWASSTLPPWLVSLIDENFLTFTFLTFEILLVSAVQCKSVLQL